MARAAELLTRGRVRPVCALTESAGWPRSDNTYLGCPCTLIRRALSMNEVPAAARAVLGSTRSELVLTGSLRATRSSRLRDGNGTKLSTLPLANHIANSKQSAMPAQR